MSPQGGSLRVGLSSRFGSSLLQQLSTFFLLEEFRKNEDDDDEEGRAENVDGRLLRDMPPKQTDSRDAFLAKCQIAVLGSLDYLTLCQMERLALLARSAHNGEQLCLLATIKLERWLEPSEEVTTLCLLAVPSRRLPGSVDGAVILIGTSDGQIFVFSERAQLLFSHSFSTHPVLSIRPLVDSRLLVTTSGDVVIIQSESLLSIVNEARKGQQVKSRIEYSTLQLKRPTPNLLDAVHSGVLPSILDKYSMASFCKFHGSLDEWGGDDLFWLTRRDTFGEVACFDSQLQPAITASLISWGKGYLPTFLRSTQSQVASRSEHCQKWSRVLAEPREMVCLSPAPGGLPFLAVADNLARVLLIDTARGCVVRIWKGYRDASVEWMVESGDRRGGGGEGESSLPSAALFLVILAPRRNLLEVWSVPNGRRMAARRVRGLFLLSSSLPFLAERQVPLPSTFRPFLLGVHGGLYEVALPFEVVLKSSSNEELHDDLVLKEVPDCPMEALEGVLSRLKTSVARQVAISLAIKQVNNITQLKELIQLLGKVEGVSSMANSLSTLCIRYERLAEKGAENADSDENGEELLASLDDCHDLFTTALEMCEREEETPRPPLSISDFLAFFDLHSHSLRLKTESVKEKVEDLARLLFSRDLGGEILPDELLCICESLAISPTALADFFSLHFLSNRPPVQMSTISYLLQILTLFLQLSPSAIKRIEHASKTSENVVRGGVLLVLISLVENANKEGEERVDGDEWQTVSSAVEWRESLLRLLPLASRVSSLSHSLSSSAKRVSLQDFFSNGPSVFREEIGRFCCSSEMKAEDVLEDERVKRLQEDLSSSLQSSLILADLAWVLMREWQGRATFDFALRSLSACHLMPRGCLREGLAYLLWEKCLVGPLRAVGEHSRLVERELHAQLVPSHRIAEFVAACSRLLILMENEEESQREEEEREEWLAPLLSHSSPPPSLPSIAARQPQATRNMLRLHRLFLAILHLELVTGGRVTLSADLLGSQRASKALFRPLNSAIEWDARLEGTSDGKLTTARVALLEKAATHPSPDIRENIDLLAHEWRLPHLISTIESRFLLRTGKDAEALVLLARLPPARQAQLLSASFAARLAQLAADSDLVLSASHSRMLKEAAGNEYCDDSSMQGVRLLADRLSSLSLHSLAIRSLLHIASTYFGIACH